MVLSLLKHTGFRQPLPAALPFASHIYSATSFSASWKNHYLIFFLLLCPVFLTSVHDNFILLVTQATELGVVLDLSSSPTSRIQPVSQPY